MSIFCSLLWHVLCELVTAAGNEAAAAAAAAAAANKANIMQLS
jgi:hypothetical protein